MAEINDLENNPNPITTPRFPEGQTIPSINDGARGLEGILARANNDRNGTNTTTGTGAAYTLTTNAAYPALTSGMWFFIRFHVANTGACTLQVNALPAKPLRKRNNAALVVGDIFTNDMVLLSYNPANDTFQVNGI